MKSLKDNIFDLKKDIVALSNRFDHRLKAMSSALEADHKQRMNNIALSYQALSVLSVQIHNPPLSASLHPNAGSPKENEKSSSSSVDHIGISATMNPSGNSASSITGATTSSQTRTESTSSTEYLMCPLMTLSGIASAIIDNASKY